MMSTPKEGNVRVIDTGGNTAGGLRVLRNKYEQRKRDVDIKKNLT